MWGQSTQRFWSFNTELLGMAQRDPLSFEPCELWTPSGEEVVATTCASYSNVWNYQLLTLEPHKLGWGRIKKQTQLHSCLTIHQKLDQLVQVDWFHYSSVSATSSASREDKASVLGPAKTLDKTSIHEDHTWVCCFPGWLPMIEGHGSTALPVRIISFTSPKNHPLMYHPSKARCLIAARAFIRKTWRMLLTLQSTPLVLDQSLGHKMPAWHGTANHASFCHAPIFGMHFRNVMWISSSGSAMIHLSSLSNCCQPCWKSRKPPQVFQ